MHTIKLFDMELFVNRIGENLPPAESDSNAEYHRCLAGIFADPKGADRRVLLGTAPLLDKLAQIAADTPNFAEVLGIITRAALLSMQTQTAMRLLPSLLTGEPGLGKSWNGSQIVKALGSAFVEHSIATCDEAGVLLGHGTSWK